MIWAHLSCVFCDPGFLNTTNTNESTKNESVTNLPSNGSNSDGIGSIEDESAHH